MGSIEQTLVPVAVALHTRDREQDYRWHPEVGDPTLAGQLRALHRDLIADQEAMPAATLILLDQGERVGLLVANLKSERTDHSCTRINDSLLLEFAREDRDAVYRLTAGLLGADSEELLRRLLDYAEARFQEERGAGTIKPLTVPVPERTAREGNFSGELYLALRSNERNQQRVIDLLHRAALDPTTVQLPFVLVSTGFVGKEKLQEQANVVKQFIALSRSSSIPENEDVVLKKKAFLGRRSAEIMGAAFCLGLLAMCSGSWVLHRNNSWNSSEASFVQNSKKSEKTLPDSEMKLPDSGKSLPDDRLTKTIAELQGVRVEVARLRDEVARLRDEVARLREELARRPRTKTIVEPYWVAGLVGSAAAPQGMPGLLVVTALLAEKLSKDGLVHMRMTR